MKFFGLLLAGFLPVVLSQKVVGSAKGFAAGVTGGGNATPQVPNSIAQLKSWLADSTPRVIVLDKEFNFLRSAGSQTATGCRPPSNTCPNNGGQDAINGANWCQASYPKVTVTYDKAALTPLEVKSNKSIVGVGSKGVLRGVGLRLSGDVQNVIIQNIHITELNPKYIWGGDAITLVGANRVWIDHCKFSLIGRQMLVTGYQPAGLVSVTNCEFDGRTSWSASCNGQHYWTMLFLGSNDKITFAGNYVHHVSGRAPKVGGSGDITLHAVNNFFYEINGHSFDVAAGGRVLAEGNVFENVKQVFTSSSATAGGTIYNQGGSGCQSALGRSCQANTISGTSGGWTNFGSTSLFSKFSGSTPYVAISTGSVKSSVLANAGIGK